MQKWERVNLSYSHSSKPNQIHCMRDDPKLLDINSIQMFFLAHTIDTYIMLPKKECIMRGLPCDGFF